MSEKIRRIYYATISGDKTTIGNIKDSIFIGIEMVLQKMTLMQWICYNENKHETIKVRPSFRRK